jgi:hypothetical protein
MISELVMPRHLCRKAIIYIRQSSPHQVLTNQESLRLQYALRQRALDLGWHEPEIEVIDTDLGLSAHFGHSAPAFGPFRHGWRFRFRRAERSCPPRRAAGGANGA